MSRLRKFLRTRRVTKIQQVGTDRILEIQFSDGLYRLFLEFYAGGNIVLTDGDLKVLALQRVVNEGAKHEHVHLGSTYNLDQRQNINGIPPLTEQRVKDGLQKWIDRQAAAAAPQQKKKTKRKEGDQLRKALAGSINEYPPMLLDHALRRTGFDTSIPPDAIVHDEALLKEVMTALEMAAQTMESIMGQATVTGYIIGKILQPKDQDEGVVTDEKKTNVIYDDFHPFRPQQFLDDESLMILEYQGFNKAVDEFFSSIEGQKLDQRLAEKEEAARKKLEHAKLDQEKRIGGLQDVQALNVRKAQAIEANVERVQEATAAINSLIAQGMDWVEIDRLIEIEQKRRNPVAEMIKLPLKLRENTATLMLGEWDAEDDQDDGYYTGSEPSDSEDDEKASKKPAQSASPAEKRLPVDIDLALSPWSNARDYYDQKRTAAAKEEKTVSASAKALKSAQQKIDADLKKSLKQEKATLRPTRQPLWFEKFIYFVSSDGYLVVGGKDAAQNELLAKRRMKKGDVYVHADLPGAVPLIVKNKAHTPDAPIPPTTLSQAGNMCIATSSAWDSKAVMSAWWAPAEKITKTAPTGDYLPAGKVSVIGDRLFLPPAQLLLGFAVMFQISEESKANHQKHRIVDPEDAAARKRVAEEAAAEAEEARAVEAAVDNNSEAGDHAHENNESQESAGEESDADESDFSEHDDDGRQNDEDDEEKPAAYSNPLQGDHASKAGEPSPVEESAPVHHDVDAPVEESGEESTDENEADAEFIEQHPPQEQHAQAHQSGAASSKSSAHTASTPAPKQAPPTRGKAGKKKKMAKKYAEQDDEDREEAMRLLGSKAGQEKAAEARAAQAKAAADAEAHRQRRKEQTQRKMAENKAKEAERLQHLEAGDDDDDAVTHTEVDLETLVGTPRPGDEILDAIPVCAPWTALGRHKYKAKLQPGATKKGKAVREILGRWAAAGTNRKFVDESAQDVEKIWPREMECVKGWREGEVFNVLPVSKVRVMQSGGEAGGKKGASSGGGGKKPQRGQKKGKK